MKLIIRDVDTRLNGEYDHDISDLTGREYHLIRQMCGITPPAVAGGLLAGDAGLGVALATVVLEREGKTVDPDALWDAPYGAIVFDFTGAGDDSPPEQPPSGGSDSGTSDEADSASKSSGRGSKQSSAQQESDQEVTGELG